MSVGQYYKNGVSRHIPSYMKEVVQYRHLILHLASSTMRDKLQGNPLGLLWLFANPLILALMFSFVFGQVFKGGMSSEYICYVIYGVVIYDYFAKSMGETLNLVKNTLPYQNQARSPTIVYILQHVVHLTVMLIMGLAASLLVSAFLNGTKLNVSLLALGYVVPLIVMLCAPVAVIFAIMGDRVPHARPAVTYVILLLYYLSPVFVPRELYDRPELALFSAVNPITQMLDAIRNPTIYGQWPTLQSLGVMVGWSVGLITIAIILIAKRDQVALSFGERN
jgi:lipopolysaccharide transport system permease protein